MSTNFSPETWITQAEAARWRGVSRQAIHRLIVRNRIATLKIGSVVFVNKIELEAYQPKKAGRPKKDE